MTVQSVLLTILISVLTSILTTILTTRIRENIRLDAKRKHDEKENKRKALELARACLLDELKTNYKLYIRDDHSLRLASVLEESNWEELELEKPSGYNFYGLSTVGFPFKTEEFDKIKDKLVHLDAELYRCIEKVYNRFRILKHHCEKSDRLSEVEFIHFKNFSKEYNELISILDK